MNSENAISQTATKAEIRDLNDLQQENDEVPELPKRTRRQSHMRLMKGISNGQKQLTPTYSLWHIAVDLMDGVAMRQWVT